MQEPMTIFSVYRADRTDAHNRALHRGALLRLRRLGARCGTLQGCYKGVQEESIGVIAPSFGVSAEIDAIARETSQESILLISVARDATLVYVESGSWERLGQLVCVPEAEALTHDAWTLDRNGYYHVVKTG